MGKQETSGHGSCLPRLPDLPHGAPTRRLVCEQDEARARRYQDELELGQRRQAAVEQAKRHAMQRELEASRVEQLAWKQERREEEQRVERADCERILAVKRQKDEAEHQEVGSGPGNRPWGGSLQGH